MGQGARGVDGEARVPFSGGNRSRVRQLRVRPGRGALLGSLLAGTVLCSVGAAPAGAADWEDRLRQLERATSQSTSGGRLQVAQVADQGKFDIAEQPLIPALLAFSDMTGIQLIFDSTLARDLTSPGLSGSFPPEQALRRLLAGTGLTYRFTDPTTVTLEKVQAAQAESGVVTLAPVMVTGERVTRSLQDTATSVVVFDSEAIEERPGIESTNDLLERIPNVTTTGTTNLAPAVRGVDGTGPAQGADAFFAGVRPRLNIQIDGRPASFNEVIFGDVALWDVEQVEVLRGPQSTLQGRNAIAGAVVVKTKDPTYDYEAGARLIAGTEETRQGSAFVSGPIIEDQLAFRLAFDRRTSESFVEMDPYLDIDPEEFESTTVRGKLLIEPKGIEGFSTVLTVNHSDHTAPQTESVKRPFDKHVVSYPDMPVFNPRATSGIIDTTLDLNDNLTVEGTFSATDLRVERHARPGDGNATIDATELVAEPRLRFWGLDGRLNGLGGVYLFSADQDESIDLFGGGTFDDSTTTAAVFAEGTLSVLDDFDVTLGGRYEEEHRKRDGGTGPFVIDFEETYEVFLPKLGVAWHATDELTVGAIVSRGYNGGGAGFTYDAPFESYTYDPEYVWNYEAYARADLYDGKLSLTGNLFYSDYKDMQLPFDLNPDPAAWSVVVRNADKAVTYGAEVGARWLALPGLELFGGVGLLKTEIEDYPGSGIEGNELPQAPSFTADFGGIYRHSSGFEISADARYSDAYFSDINNNPRGKTDPYFVVNSQIGYSFSTDFTSLRLFAFINNLFDADEPVLLTPGATPADDVANLLYPRTFGVGLEMTF